MARTPVSVEDSTNGDGGPAAPVREASPTGSGPPAADALRDSVATVGSAMEPCAKESSASKSVKGKRQESQRKEKSGVSDPAASGRQMVTDAEQPKAVVGEDAAQTSSQEVKVRDVWDSALTVEMGQRDTNRANVFQMRAAVMTDETVAAQEAERWQRKTARRRKRKQTKKDRKDVTRGDAVEIVEDAEATHRKALKDFRAMAELAELLSNWTDAGTVPLHVSRARRRAEKRVLKARTKERRARLALDAQKQASRYPTGTYFNMDEHQRSGGHAQKATKTYGYRSGSMYKGHGTLLEKETVKEVQVGKLRAVQAPAMDLLPTAMMRIRGQWRPVKLDTGPQYCVAGRQWQALGTKLDKPAPVGHMEGFSGAPVAVLGVWRFEFESQYHQPVRVDALVVAHDMEDFLIGEDWMYDKGVKIDFLSGEMKWYDGEVRMLLLFGGVGNSEQREARAAKVRLLRKAKVQTQTVHHVEVAVPAEDGEVGIMMPRTRKEKHLLVAPTLVTVKSGKEVVPILNLAGRTTKLPSKEKLGTWVLARGEPDILELDDELDRNRVAAWLETLSTQSTTLSNEDELEIGEMEVKDRDLMLELLRSYPSLLEPNNRYPPATTLGVVHHINTGSAPPIKVRPRRHSRAEHETIDSEVEAMLHDVVIEYGSGAWGFPVGKRMGQSAHDGCGAPGAHLEELFLVYLDDVIIYTSGDISCHVVELAVVLERLAQAGLSLKTRKCSFAMKKLEYLGHELDADGIRSLASRVESVRRFPVPQDAVEVRRFVHLAEYYTTFVPNFGTKAAPMTKLLRRTTEWMWGPEQQEAFELLKGELTKRPLSIYPGFTKPFKLVTDASVVGLGAALMQNHGSGDQPVAFASKVNSPTVARYGITDLECAAVVWAIRLFRPYLYGSRSELVTDHAALTWLVKTKDLSGRLHRWALQLQEYNVTITYRAGSTNVAADALSRAPVKTLTTGGQPREPAEEDVQLVTPREPGAEGLGSSEVVTAEEAVTAEVEPTIERGQLTDTEVGKWVRKLQRDGKYLGQQIITKDGLVYLQGNDKALRVVLPVALRAKALREAHDSIYSALADAADIRASRTNLLVARNADSGEA
ncbi:unnamed protein product [Phytophthora fragariaefolia]|uniref:Unnamed protein product n=1 Tax=Phytophthora fragariaefolia TaxID=1490495 RepID=A0A9W6Y1H8_9STRA|nr:unnamed protein product [Phytophthora fragariaefolia]